MFAIFYRKKNLEIPQEVSVASESKSNLDSKKIVASQFESKNLNPFYISGFTDGEGSFSFSILRNKTQKIGWAVRLNFSLVAAKNPANERQFQLIKDYFGVGQVVERKALTPNSNPSIYFVVRNFQDCIVIRKHFENYPLITTKLVQFKLWCLVMDLMFEKAQFTDEGLNRIVALKLHSPMGLSDLLKLNFPKYLNYTQPCPTYNPNFANLNIFWIAGFINADGHFRIQIQKSSASLNKVQCVPVIQITQHLNSLVVLEEIKKYLGLGSVKIRNTNAAADFLIRNIKEANQFIEKFETAELLGAKALDYFVFCESIDLINNKKHLTEEGLALIKQKNSNVNSKRTIFTTED